MLRTAEAEAAVVPSASATPARRQGAQPLRRSSLPAASSTITARSSEIVKHAPLTSLPRDGSEWRAACFEIGRELLREIAPANRVGDPLVIVLDANEPDRL
jgi:hypothetical protein